MRTQRSLDLQTNQHGRPRAVLEVKRNVTELTAIKLFAIVASNETDYSILSHLFMRSCQV